MKNPVFILTPGDPADILPEITWKAIQGGIEKKTSSQILCVGALAPFQKMGVPVVDLATELPGFDTFTPKNRIASFLKLKRKNKNQQPKIFLFRAPQTAPKGAFLCGYQAGWSIQKAASWVLDKTADALVTGPIHKDRLNKGGYPFPGHTEFLEFLCKTPPQRLPRKISDRAIMMLANQDLRITLVTIHMALQDVPKALKAEIITETVEKTVAGLNEFWGIKKPKIAVAALNPHAGESGRFGNEEIQIITPAIKKLTARFKNRASIVGPLPADTLFAKNYLAPKSERFDAVVCMYHDQGLIPVKLLDFHKTVNVTLGLPLIRTSVDHGVGFDIAGKNLANPSSLCSAIELAAEMVHAKQADHKKVHEKHRKRTS